MGDDLILGARAIGAFYGLTEAATVQRIRRGQIPAFKLGGSVAARRSTLEASIASAEARAQKSSRKEAA